MTGNVFDDAVKGFTAQINKFESQSDHTEAVKGTT